MTGRAIRLALALLVAAAPALAEGPFASPRPAPRPGSAQTTIAQLPDRVILVSNVPGVKVSLRPMARPNKLAKRTTVAATRKVVKQPALIAKGAAGRKICGDKTIRGQRLSPIPGRIRGCGLSDPVKVTSVDGVTLSQPATLDCTTAKALRSWVSDTVKPTVGRLGGGVSQLRVAAHYSCRTRNNQPGAKISEHGRGRAIDISAIELKNGVSLTVLKGWRDPTQGKLLKRMHKGACGKFGTVLGPNSDKHHKDHFHFDTARYRGGAYCR